MINVKAISTNVGKALLVSALFMFISLMISIYEGMDSAFTPLLISFIITSIVGAFPFIFVRGAQPLTLKDGFLTIFLAWLLSFVFGMLPYVLWGGEFHPLYRWLGSCGLPPDGHAFCEPLSSETHKHGAVVSLEGGLSI